MFPRVLYKRFLYIGKDSIYTLKSKRESRLQDLAFLIESNEKKVNV